MTRTHPPWRRRLISLFCAFLLFGGIIAVPVRAADQVTVSTTGRASWSSACKRLHQETVAKRPSRKIPEDIQPRRANHSRKSISHPTAEPLACKPHTIFVREQEKTGDTDVAQALLYTVFSAQHNDIPTFMATDTCYRRCGSTLRKRDKRDCRKPWTINWQHSGKPYGRTYRIS